MHIVRGAELGNRRQIADLGLVQESGYINPFGVLQRYKAGEIEPQEHSLAEMQVELTHATRFNLRSGLTRQLGITGEGVRLFLIDHPQKASPLFG